MQFVCAGPQLMALNKTRSQQHDKRQSAAEQRKPGKKQQTKHITRAAETQQQKQQQQQNGKEGKMPAKMPPSGSPGGAPVAGNALLTKAPPPSVGPAAAEG